MTNTGNAAVESEASWCRANDCLCRLDVSKNRICPDCGSGEVTYPMQTCAPPYINKCLRCGLTDKIEVFKIA